eukprot:7902613-Lingulodinium_polyedra.AAC.1
MEDVAVLTDSDTGVAGTPTDSDVEGARPVKRPAKRARVKHCEQLLDFEGLARRLCAVCSCQKRADTRGRPAM